MLIPIADERLAFWSPLPVDRSQEAARLERFPRAAYDALAGQVGPLANLRSSSGCAVVLTTDSPLVTLHLSALRHHQPVPQGITLEIADGAGWRHANSLDLREITGDCAVTLATGLTPGQPRAVWCWLPTITTVAVTGLTLADGAQVVSTSLPQPRWLALGDSLTQGFTVQAPVQTWVHRLMRRHALPAWNLGVGGMRIEPAACAWALRARTWDLVTIALGSNHGWWDRDVATVEERAEALLEVVRRGGPDGAHRRVVWCLPPWKPCEEGKGPPDFAGVRLDRATGERIGRVRELLRARLAHEPGLIVVEDLLPRDARWYPDGLHPAALGFAHYADAVDRALGPEGWAFPSAGSS